jgi:tetratricopeptide (TPR) repeat protein
MQFDPNNKIVKLCVQGMNMEAQKAKQLFLQAWNEASNDFDKFIAAHFVARHQKTVKDKLKWDITALHCALKIHDDDMKAYYPSLYLNIGKCYEDLKNVDKAIKNYQLALSYTDYLQDDGYGRLIKSGINNGINRLIQQ